MMEVFSLLFFPCALVVLIVWLNSRERLIRYRMQADLYTQTLEKGQAVPSLSDFFFVEPVKRNSSLKAGLICIAVGVAISLGFWLVGSYIGSKTQFGDVEQMASAFTMFACIGILPFMIGVAFMIIHFFEKKRDAAGKAQ